MKRIADSTVRRLSHYLRFLEEFEGRGLSTVSSDELAKRGISCGVANARFAKPIDAEELLTAFGIRVAPSRVAGDEAAAAAAAKELGFPVAVKAVGLSVTLANLVLLGLTMMAIGSAFPGSEVKEMEVKGRNLSEGVPRSFTISSNEILEALTDPLNSIVSAVKSALERTPPELSADIYDRGAVLTGGGALRRSMPRWSPGRVTSPITGPASWPRARSSSSSATASTARGRSGKPKRRSRAAMTSHWKC